ncbi:MAG: RidA family protein [Sulfitobacter sp.]
MIKRIKSNSAFEDKVGYCRVVVAGGFAHVAGTVAPGPDVSDNVADQCKSALAVIETALLDANCGFQDVVRVRYILPNRHDFKACWPVLSATFGANPPVATMIESGLIDPKYKIEIEVTALLPKSAT